MAFRWGTRPVPADVEGGDQGNEYVDLAQLPSDLLRGLPIGMSTRGSSGEEGTVSLGGQMDGAGHASLASSGSLC